jgi:uncharacterized protein YuzE
MEKFNFDYDLDNDDLFVYLEDKKSSGAVELGNFILDFDKEGNLVAFQILKTSEVFSKILSKMIEIAKIKQIQAEIINFRNMDAIKFKVITDDSQETANILIPHIVKKSPVLEY